MRRRVGVVVLVAGFLLTSCGGDEIPDATSSPSTAASSAAPALPSPAATPGEKSAASAHQVVDRYLDALFAGEPKKACLLLTPRYQKASIKEAASSGARPDADCAAAIRSSINLIATVEVLRADFAVTAVKTSGDTATVTVDAPDGFQDVTYVLRWVAKRWLIDDEG
ncbi:MAG: hypothetical protein NTV23_04240 [Propionibacteriales bacterium]|nr:hypothetical protein [Propionibacteriales bacterium]